METATTNNQVLGDDLNRLLSEETRSLMRHLDEATPYLTAQTHGTWNRLRGVAEMSLDHAERLSGLIDSLGLAFHPTTYPQEVACYHYADLPFLLLRLIAEKKKQIASYRHAIEHAVGYPELLDELNDLLSETREQLKCFEAGISR